MTVKAETNSPKRLCIWAETPEQRHSIETRLPDYRRSLMPVSYQGQELADVIKAGRMDGIIFHSENVSLVKIMLHLLEDQCPSCSRFVICTRSNDAQYRSLEGFPPPF